MRVTSTFRSSEGAPINEVPEHLNKLLVFGLNFVPSPHVLPFLKVLIPRISNAYTELNRVLTWDVHYMPNPPEVDLFEVLPFSYFFKSRGAMSSKVVGPKYM